MNTKTIRNEFSKTILLTAALASLVGCSSPDTPPPAAAMVNSQVAPSPYGNYYGPSRPLYARQIVGRWRSGCTLEMSGQYSQSVIEFTADGRGYEEKYLYDGYGCEFAVQHYYINFTYVLNANGQPLVRNLVPGGIQCDVPDFAYGNPMENCDQTVFLPVLRVLRGKIELGTCVNGNAGCRTQVLKHVQS